MRASPNVRGCRQRIAAACAYRAAGDEPSAHGEEAPSLRRDEFGRMDVPLAGLGMFGGWIVLVVATDVFGIFRISGKRLTTAFLVISLAGAIACGYVYLQEKHPKPCPRPPVPARR